VPDTVLTALESAAQAFAEALAGDVTDDLCAKLTSAPVKRAYMCALGMAVGYYATRGRRAMARLLLREDTLLAHPEVAYELTYVLRADREPDLVLIGRYWQVACLDAGPADVRAPDTGRQEAGAWYDWSGDASLLVERLEDELRDSEVFGPVFQSYDLGAIAAGAGPSRDTLFSQLERVAELLHMPLNGSALELLPGDEGTAQGATPRGRVESHTNPYEQEYYGMFESYGEAGAGEDESPRPPKGVSGDEVGGDQVGGDKVGQDKVGGDKTTVGDVSGGAGVAIGEGAQAIVNKIERLIIYTGDDAATDADGPSRSASPLIEEAIRLDVAAPPAAVLNEPFDLAVAVRQPDAPKLAVEDLTEVLSGEGSIFRTEEAEIVKYRVEVTGADCEVEPESYTLKLRPRRNSRVCFFMVTPRRLGVRSLFVNAYQEDESLAASTRIRIEVQVAVQGQGA
jgi:hypothetical protein